MTYMAELHKAKVKLWPEVEVERPFGHNAAEKIQTALVKVGFCYFEMGFKVIYRTTWAASSKSMTE